MTRGNERLLLSQYRRALRFVRPYTGRLVLITLAGIAATATGLWQPYLSKLLIDRALLRHDFHALLLVAALMAGATIAGFALNVVSSYQYVRVSAQILFDMRLALYRHLQTLSPRFWARNRLGDVVSRVNNDAGEVQRISADTLLALGSNLVFLAGSASIMASLSLRLFLVSAAVLPVSIWALRCYQVRLSNQVRAVRERSADIGSFLIETLLGFRVVAVHRAEEREVERFRDRNGRFVDALMAMQRTSLIAGALPGTVVTLATAAFFLYGGKLVIDGAITVGSLVALMAYHMRLLAPIQNLMGLYTGFVAGGVSLGRLFELFDTPAEVTEACGSIPLTSARGAIAFESVCFRYADAPVLEDVSFRIEPGRFCAIVGPSGSGKSTLADLLIRFYDPQAGAVLLDGHDLRSLRLADLRREIVLVDQSSFLFQASVRENLAYGNPEASDDEIEQAARAAAIHDRIAAMPDGYSTIVGERGMTLSAGERHRITLARALLRNPSVLVLDEPTAALDAETEREIARTLRAALAGRTAILITHRESLAAAADHVIALEAGRVVTAASCP